MIAPGLTRSRNVTLESRLLLLDNGVMPILETLRTKQRDEILRLATAHGCHNVRVFGSVATGNSRPDSDIDFLVDLDPDHNLFDLGGLLSDLTDLLGARVDVVETRCLHPYILDRVLAEAVRL